MSSTIPMLCRAVCLLTAAAALAPTGGHAAEPEADCVRTFITSSECLGNQESVFGAFLAPSDPDLQQLGDPDWDWLEHHEQLERVVGPIAPRLRSLFTHQELTAINKNNRTPATGFSTTPAGKKLRASKAEVGDLCGLGGQLRRRAFQQRQRASGLGDHARPKRPHRPFRQLPHAGALGSSSSPHGETSLTTPFRRDR